MAEHLSFLNGKSHQYIYQEENGRRSSADESESLRKFHVSLLQQLNPPCTDFAREIMQLFTIGLLVLNDDGTPVLDKTGVPLETYTNDHIEQFARAWTGFRRVQARGNYEENARSDGYNRLDPMRVDAEWRDPWPITDLTGGFIGDRYVLCSDLPDKSFLKAGAKYILNGGSPLPTLMTDPDE